MQRLLFLQCSFSSGRNLLSDPRNLVRSSFLGVASVAPLVGVKGCEVEGQGLEREVEVDAEGLVWGTGVDLS